MGVAEIIALLPYIIEAAKLIPSIKDLLDRVERGEKVTPEEARAAVAAASQIPGRFDDTPAG